MSETRDEKLVIPDAMIFRLIERDGTLWQLGRPWPTPKGVEEKNTVDCTISCILRFDTEENEETGEREEIEPYFEIIGQPKEGGKFAERGMGVITQLDLGDVYRTESLQSAEVLAIYAAEMTNTTPPVPAGSPGN